VPTKKIMNNIKIKLPDGAVRELPAGSSAMDLAKAISPRLADVIVVSRVNGLVQDVRDPLPDGSSVELFKADSPEGIDTLRHSCEHVLATAVCRLFPGAQVTMGPKSHDGEFYYDFDVGRAFTPDDLLAIEKEMAKIIEAKVPFEKRLVSKEEALHVFEGLKQRYKPEILAWIPDDQVSIYQNADFVDLCRGPHLPHAGFIKAFRLLGVSGSYWRADANREMLQRINGIAFASKADLDAYLYRIEEAKKRDHRKLGTHLDLFSVSDRYDSHEYSPDQAVELLVTGTTRENVAALLDDDFMSQVAAVFAPREVRISGYSLSPHVRGETLAWDVEVRLFSSPIDKDKKQTLKNLEDSVNKRHPTGRLRVVVETKYVEEVGPGLVTWLPKGGRLRTTIEDLSRKLHYQGGYEMVFSPHIAKSDLWKVSGHWRFYRDSMFSPMAIDGQEYVMKPMNCPFHILAYKNRPRSYRDLPIRIAELGTVYRYELAGVMHGLMRVRGFTQDDAHLFCRWDQVDHEIDNVIGFILRMFKTFGFSKFEVNLSTRPAEFVGEVSEWDKAEAALLAAVKRHDLPYAVDAGGGAFYGPKIDIKLRDCLDRSWQCSTVQLDFNNPERFNLQFTNSEGKPERAVMIHRALLGSLERFVGILIEEYAGAFPMWLSPEQVRVLSIADRHQEHAQKIAAALRAQDLRVQAPTNSEKLGAKIREAQMDKIPVMLVVGDQEVEKGGASVRLRSGEDLGFMNEAQLIEYCKTASQIPVVN